MTSQHSNTGKEVLELDRTLRVSLDLGIFWTFDPSSIARPPQASLYDVLAPNPSVQLLTLGLPTLRSNAAGYEPVEDA